jgi:hypothetical protein
MSDDYHIEITAPSNPEAFAQLVYSLSAGDTVVWNGRSEPFEVVEILESSSSPNSIGRFKKRLRLTNPNRKNGAEFRLSFDSGSEGYLEGMNSISAQCHVQRQIGENGNDNGWGATTTVESLKQTNLVESLTAN